MNTSLKFQLRSINLLNIFGNRDGLRISKIDSHKDVHNAAPVSSNCIFKYSPEVSIIYNMVLSVLAIYATDC
jgi:hypothetical protein